MEIQVERSVFDWYVSRGLFRSKLKDPLVKNKVARGGKDEIDKDEVGDLPPKEQKVVRDGRWVQQLFLSRIDQQDGETDFCGTLKMNRLKLSETICALSCYINPWAHVLAELDMSSLDVVSLSQQQLDQCWSCVLKGLHDMETTDKIEKNEAPKSILKQGECTSNVLIMIASNLLLQSLELTNSAQLRKLEGLSQQLLNASTDPWRIIEALKDLSRSVAYSFNNFKDADTTNLLSWYVLFCKHSLCDQKDSSTSPSLTSIRNSVKKLLRVGSEEEATQFFTFMIAVTTLLWTGIGDVSLVPEEVVTERVDAGITCLVNLGSLILELGSGHSEIEESQLGVLFFTQLLSEPVFCAGFRYLYLSQCMTTTAWKLAAMSGLFFVRQSLDIARFAKAYSTMFPRTKRCLQFWHEVTVDSWQALLCVKENRAREHELALHLAIYESCAYQAIKLFSCYAEALVAEEVLYQMLNSAIALLELVLLSLETSGPVLCWQQNHKLLRDMIADLSTHFSVLCNSLLKDSGLCLPVLLICGCLSKLHLICTQTETSSASQDHPQQTWCKKVQSEVQNTLVAVFESAAEKKATSWRINPNLLFCLLYLITEILQSEAMTIPTRCKLIRTFLKLDIKTLEKKAVDFFLPRLSSTLDSRTSADEAFVWFSVSLESLFRLVMLCQTNSGLNRSTLVYSSLLASEMVHAAIFYAKAKLQGKKYVCLLENMMRQVMRKGDEVEASRVKDSVYFQIFFTLATNSTERQRVDERFFCASFSAEVIARASQLVRQLLVNVLQSNPVYDNIVNSCLSDRYSKRDKQTRLFHQTPSTDQLENEVLSHQKGHSQADMKETLCHSHVAAPGVSKVLSLGKAEVSLANQINELNAMVDSSSEMKETLKLLFERHQSRYEHPSRDLRALPTRFDLKDWMRFCMVTKLVPSCLGKADVSYIFRHLTASTAYSKVGEKSKEVQQLSHSMQQQKANHSIESRAFQVAVCLLYQKVRKKHCEDQKQGRLSRTPVFHTLLDFLRYLKQFDYQPSAPTVKLPKASLSRIPTVARKHHVIKTSPILFPTKPNNTSRLRHAGHRQHFRKKPRSSQRTLQKSPLGRTRAFVPSIPRPKSRESVDTFDEDFVSKVQQQLHSLGLSKH